jgi:hypothetical protein
MGDSKMRKTSLVELVGIGVVSGFILGFLFVFMGTLLPRIWDPNSHVGEVTPFKKLVLGGIWGVFIGSVVTPFFYFKFLKRMEINVRMVATIFIYVFLSGLVGFLIFSPAVIVTSCIGFLLACYVLNKKGIKNA